jgi:hypothetical protein
MYLVSAWHLADAKALGRQSYTDSKQQNSDLSLTSSKQSKTKHLKRFGG